MATRLFSLLDGNGRTENIDWSLDALNDVVVTGDFAGAVPLVLATVPPPGGFVSVVGSAASLYVYSTTAFASLFTINFQEQTAGGQTATGYLYSTNGAAAPTRRLYALSAAISSTPVNSTASTSVTYAALGGYQGFELVRGDADATITNNTTHNVTSDTHKYVYLITNGTTRGTHAVGVNSGSASFVGGVAGYGIVGVYPSYSTLLSEDLATGKTIVLVHRDSAGSFSDLYDDVGGGREFVNYASGGTGLVYATDGAHAIPLFSYAGAVSFQGAYLGGEVFRIDNGATQTYFATEGSVSRTYQMLSAPLADTVEVTADALKIEFIDKNSSGVVVQRAWYDAEDGQRLGAGQDYELLPTGGWYDVSTEGKTHGQPNYRDSVLVDAAVGGGLQHLNGVEAHFVTIAGSAQGSLLFAEDMALVGSDGAAPTILSGEAQIGYEMLIDASHAGFDLKGKYETITVYGSMVFNDGGSGAQESVVQNHAKVYVDRLVFSGGDGGYPKTILSVDGDSLLEVGGGTYGHEGTITVDVSATIDLGANGSQDNRINAPTFVVNGSIVSSTPTTLGHANALQAFKVVNHGLISGVSVNDAAVVNNAGTISLDNNTMGATINDGVLIAAGGFNNLDGDVTGLGSIEIAEGGALKTQQVSAGQTLSYTGAAGWLSISQSSLDASQTYGATIEGFGNRHVINYYGTVTSAGYSGGVLTLDDGATEVAHLKLAGDYSSATFAVSQNAGYARITATGAGLASEPTHPTALLGGALLAASTSTGTTAYDASTGALSLSASALGLH